MAELSHVQLAGQLSVRPGVSRPHNLISTRRNWVQSLTQGKSASHLPGLLGTVFNLCGHAHQLCSGLAVRAAQGVTGAISTEQQSHLQVETLREHLRRICLDWPRQLVQNNESNNCVSQLAFNSLLTCPIPIAQSLSNAEIAQALLKLPQWLENQLLHQPVAQWLSSWQQSPQAWLLHWSQSTPHSWLAQLLSTCQTGAHVSAQSTALALRLHESYASLLSLASRLNQNNGLTQLPLWHNTCAETGTWTRLNLPAAQTYLTPWLRLGARLAELIRLSLPTEENISGAKWLRMGSVHVDVGEGLAWVEMARGLLIHHVVLEGTGKDAKVLRCNVLAPTEWNFHPEGAVAQALEMLPQQVTPEAQMRIHALMTAFDPCVCYDILFTQDAAELKNA